jgi:hypothetical protein
LKHKRSEQYDKERESQQTLRAKPFYSKRRSTGGTLIHNFSAKRPTLQYSLWGNMS